MVVSWLKRITEAVLRNYILFAIESNFGCGACHSTFGDNAMKAISCFIAIMMAVAIDPANADPCWFDHRTPDHCSARYFWRGLDPGEACPDHLDTMKGGSGLGGAKWPH